MARPPSVVSWTSANRSSMVTGTFPSFQLDPEQVRQGLVRVYARAPSGKNYQLDIVEKDGVVQTQFEPTEIGKITRRIFVC